MQNQKNDFKEFSIRIPENLDVVLQEDAVQNKRSKSKQVNFILEEHYAEKLVENSEKQQELN